MFAIAHPNLMRLLAPIGKHVARDKPAIGARARIFRQRGLDDIFLQNRLDAVGRDDDIGLGHVAVGELQSRRRIVLFEPDAAVAGADRARRQGRRQRAEQIGAMHSIHAVPAARVGREDRADDGAVHAAIFGTLADLGPDLSQGIAQSHSLKLAQTVRVDEHPGTDFAEGVGLLVDRDVETPAEQRICGGESANSASNHGSTKRLHSHDSLRNHDGRPRVCLNGNLPSGKKRLGVKPRSQGCVEPATQGEI